MLLYTKTLYYIRFFSSFQFEEASFTLILISTHLTKLCIQNAVTYYIKNFNYNVRAVAKNIL
jgi:hypothetical protein